MENQSFWNRIYPYIKSSLVPTVILSAIWLVLGWLYSAGINNLFFSILNFLTGSVNGLYGSMIGGIIGRSLFVLCLHDFARELFVNKGSLGERFNQFGSAFKKDILNMIPQYGNIHYFYGEKNKGYLGCGLLGIGLAVVLYPFVTSNGSLVNSSVLIFIFFALIRDVANEGGLVKAIIRYLIAKNKLKISIEGTDRVLTGFALGSILSLIPAFIRQMRAYAIYRFMVRTLPVILIIAGIVMIFMGKSGKENA